MDQLRRDPVVAGLGTKTTRRAALAAALLALVALAGCQGCRATSASAPRSLTNAETSPDALARKFLSCLAADDLEAMKALRVSKDEFCRYVFPELPASKMNNVTCDFVWDQATLTSMAGMKHMLDANAKRRYELVSVRFQGTERHQTYNVLQKPVVTVRDETGTESEMRLFGSMLEMDGQYKLFSFVGD